MDELIERLEAASEGSRELDAEIAAAVLPGKVEWRQTNFTMEMRPIRRFETSASLSGRASEPVEHYTASIDAALTLMPAGWLWDVASTGCVWVMPEDRLDEQIVVAGIENPIIALCVAALRARSANPVSRGS